MNTPAHRGAFTVILGMILTVVACYAGLLAMPSLLKIWLWSLVLALPLAPLTLLFPIIAGAKYALPVTCVIFPLTAMFWVSRHWWASFVYMMFGLICGPLSFYLVSIASDPIMNAASRRDFALAATFSGAIVGLIFGFAIWTLDRGALQTPSNSDASLGEHTRLALGVSVGFIVLGLAVLMMLPA